MAPRGLAEAVLSVIEEQATSFDGPLGLDTPLGADGLGLDSIAILEVVLMLEQRTGVRLRDENLTAEALSTPASLIRFLEQSRPN